MQVNLNRPCPFWPDDGACAIRDCSVNACKEVSIDYKYWRMAWRKAAETFQNVTIHGLVMRTRLISQTLQIGTNWVTSLLKWKTSFSPLLPSDFFYYSSVISTKFIVPSPLNKNFVKWANTRLSQFCACCLFFMTVSSCREYAPTDTKHSIACLFLDLLRRKKKWISWSPYNAQWLV